MDGDVYLWVHPSYSSLYLVGVATFVGTHYSVLHSQNGYSHFNYNFLHNYFVSDDFYSL